MGTDSVTVMMSIEAAYNTYLFILKSTIPAVKQYLYYGQITAIMHIIYAI